MAIIQDKHKIICKKAFDAIQELFNDQSVPTDIIAGSLAALRDEIELLLEILPPPDFGE